MTFVLIANKCDLESQRQVSEEMGQQFAKENGMIFIETSAKTALNVEASFVKTADIIYEKIKSNKIDPTNDSLGIKLGNEINDRELKLLRRSDRPSTNGTCGC